MEKNKTGKYLKYAIGEIILVVIGILIALQINNSNEARKNDKIEYQYLIRLKAEFESTLQESNETLSYSNEYKRLSELLLNVISTDTIVNLTELIFAIETAHYGSPPTVNQNVWQDITNTGKSGVIKNSNLRFLISDYYQILEKHWNMYNGQWVKSREESGSIKSTILPWQDRKLVFNSFNYILDDLKNTNLEFSTDYNTIINSLKKIPILESTTMSVLITQNVDNLYNSREILKVQEIIDAIDLELERWN